MHDLQKIGSLGMVITGTALVVMVFALALFFDNMPSAFAAVVAMVFGWASNAATVYNRQFAFGVAAVLCYVALAISAGLLLV